MSGAEWQEQLKWDQQGLMPAIAQDETTGVVLMVAWMNREALQQTAATGFAVYWSRSRGKLWRKGESSGHMQQVSDIRTDCDADVILLKVKQTGGIACHTGRVSCFYRKLDGLAALTAQSGSSSEPPAEPKWVDVEPVLKDPREIYSADG